MTSSLLTRLQYKNPSGLHSDDGDDDVTASGNM